MQRSMWREKCFYLAYFSAQVAIGPFLPLFYDRKGFSNSQIGVLAAARPWISAPSAFVWSAIADHHSAHKLVLLLTFISATLLTSALYFASSYSILLLLVVSGQLLAAPTTVIADASTVAKCGQEYGKVRLWGAIGWGIVSAIAGKVVSTYGLGYGFVMQLALSLPVVVIALGMDFGRASSLTGDKEQQAQGDEGQQVEPLLGRAERRLQSDTDPEPDSEPPAGGTLPATASDAPPPEPLPSSPLSPAAQRDYVPPQLLDSLTPRKRTQGHQPIPSSPLTSHHGSRPTTPRRTMRTAPLSNAQLTPAFTPKAGSAPLLPQICDSRCSRSLLRHPMLRLLSTPDALVFLLMALWMGLGVGIIDTFIFLHISNLGGSEFLMGLMLTVTCAAEIPSFHFQPWFLKAVGLEGMLHMVLAAFVLRLTGYALLPWLPSVWLVLPIELLHGVTFAWAWGSGAIKCQELAPEGWGTTMQGVFQGVYFGLGSGLGALVGGIVSSFMGLQCMFAVMAGVIASGWAVCAVMEWWWGVGGWRRGGVGKDASQAEGEEQRGANEHLNGCPV